MEAAEAGERTVPADTCRASLARCTDGPCVLIVLSSLQSRIMLLPSWSVCAIVIMLVLPMIGVWLSGGH
jgi:hypothetical protein